MEEKSKKEHQQPRIPIPIRKLIVSKSKEGFKQKHIAEMLEVSQSAVSKILRKAARGLPIQDRARRYIPSKITPKLRKRLAFLCDKHDDMTSHMLQDYLKIEHNICVSKVTILRALKKENIGWRGHSLKPLLSESNKKQRRKKAREWSKPGSPYMQSVLFTDERAFPRIHTGSQRGSLKRYSLAKELLPTQEKATFNGGYVYMWGAISPKGIVAHATYEPSMTAPKYIKILKDSLFNSRVRRPFQGPWYFQQDNWSVHRAKAVHTFLHTKSKSFHFEVLDWPAKSPDLNLIENVWAEMQRRLDGYETHAADLNELRQRIGDVIAELNSPASGQYWTNLFESRSKRLRAVIKSRGRMTKY